MKIYGGMQFNIEYSDNIETITSENFNGVDSKWSVLYTGEEKLVTAYTGYDGYKDSVIVKINYKLKANATGSATVTLKNIELSNVIGEKTNLSGNVTKTVTINQDDGQIPEPITKTLTSISITTKPTKVSYTEGESFDKTGMVVTASYSDGTSAVVSGYTYSPSGKLQTTNTKITISYTEGNVTKTVEQPITVAKASTGNENNNGGTNNNTGNVETNQGTIKQDDKTVADKVLAKTGITNHVVIITSVVIIIGIVSYIKYKKYKEI